MRDLKTGDVAKVCRVCARTVHKWLSDGLIPHYFLPGGRHRRIVYKDFVDFLEQQRFPPGCMERLQNVMKEINNP